MFKDIFFSSDFDALFQFLYAVHGHTHWFPMRETANELIGHSSFQ